MWTDDRDLRRPRKKGRDLKKENDFILVENVHVFIDLFIYHSKGIIFCGKLSRLTLCAEFSAISKIFSKCGKFVGSKR